MADRRRPALIAALAVLVMTAAPGAAVATSERAGTVGADTVRAVLRYAKQGFAYDDLRLTIRRDGKRFEWRLGRAYARPRLHVRDLDADGDPEVWVDTYTGGAHCCTVSRIYRFAEGRYRVSVHSWGNVFPPYRLADLDRDRRPELRSADDRFAYVFTSFAGSAFPVRIWRFDHGRLLDVTRRFPGRVRADSDALWRSYRRLHPVDDDVRGVLAAWMADQCLLGREREGWDVLGAAYGRGELGPTPALAGWAQGRAYLRTLRAFLRRTGYLRG